MLNIKSPAFLSPSKRFSFLVPPLPTEVRRYRIPLLLLLVLASFVPLHSQVGQVHGLRPIGGQGGSPFADMCPTNYFLTGVTLHAGDDVDAIQQLCLGLDDRRPIDAPWRGGDGGSLKVLLCPAKTPAVVAMFVAAEGQKTVVVNNIHIYCGLASNGHRLVSYAEAVFDGPSFKRSSGPMAPFAGALVQDRDECAAGQIALGLTGSSGASLDAIGIICGPPPALPKPVPPPVSREPVKSIGRVNVGGGPTPGPPMSICERAADARARKSPAAPYLEAQCTPEGAKIAAAEKADLAPGASGVPTSICDAAQAAINRGGIEAADLTAKCNAAGGGQKLVPVADQLSATATALIRADPLLAEFERRQPPGETHRGFEIGVGATGSDTLWGPGKQRILDSLPVAQQEGFKLAASYLLDRNHYAALDAVGIKIAASDPLVQRARTADPDVRYWLGFDIASALYGDPKLGSEGSRSTGPGSARILASLSPPAQRGFTASTQFHLARTY
jgi:hypothetical protein